MITILIFCNILCVVKVFKNIVFVGLKGQQADWLTAISPKVLGINVVSQLACSLILIGKKQKQLTNSCE